VNKAGISLVLELDKLVFYSLIFQNCTPHFFAWCLSERENKIKKVKISEKSTQPVATIDDLKATVKTLKLGAVTPPGMRKASSSQSLNSKFG